jgi:hypothetical protein
VLLTGVLRDSKGVQLREAEEETTSSVEWDEDCTKDGRAEAQERNSEGDILTASERTHRRVEVNNALWEDSRRETLY